jgi:predicted nucleotidyltransferase
VAGRAAHRALRRLLEDPASPVRRPNREEMAALHAMHRPDTPLSLHDFVRLQSRKVNEGRFRGRQYFIRFVKWPAELRERYGDRRFESLGSATIRARVKDDHDAIFTPCRYAVEGVTFLDGPPVADLREVVSFRGRFSDQARVGEWAVARGGVERVVAQAGLAYHRLVVGGRAGDYLLGREDGDAPKG